MANSNPPDSNAKNSGQAIWSLILGILSNTCLWIFGSIPAIILGILAIRKIDQSEGRLTGRGLAIGGIATGGVGVLVGLIPMGIVASLVLPVSMKVKEKAEQAKQVSEMRQIFLGCLTYASDNENRFPADLAMLIPDYLDSADLLEWSQSGASPSETMPYRYRPELGDMTRPDEPFLAAPVPINRKIAVAFVDGRVETITEEEFNLKYADSFP